MNSLLNIPGLIRVLQAINASRLTLAVRDMLPNPDSSAAESLIETLFCPSQSLAVYGTLAPGAANAEIMTAIAGTWQPGQVRGHRYDNSAGAARGYPGMVWDMDAPSQPVQLFQGPTLPQHWRRLDEFEGEGYVRILVPVEIPVTTADPSIGMIRVTGTPEKKGLRLLAIANLYALRPASIPQYGSCQQH